MAYVKNCNPGKIMMDLPQDSYIYELPLLSFSDIHGEMNLSLIFNYEMKFENQNLFALAAGYKLNIHKKLIFESGIPVTLIDTNGGNISVTEEGWPYGLYDESKRIIRQTNISGKPYVIENADYSKEYYNSSGLLVSVVDKYGVEVLKYNYSASDGRLATLVYRNEKTIQFAYSSNKISTITYSEAGCTTRLTYTSTGISVRHYAGEVINLALSNEMDFSATAALSTHATKIKKVSNYSVAISEYIGSTEINKTTYNFWEMVGGASVHGHVDVTNYEGVKSRLQYHRSQLVCSYELTLDGEARFLSNKFDGDVRVYISMEDPRNSGGFGTQRRIDGRSMTYNGNLPIPEWTHDISDTTASNTGGYYVLSGWTKVLNSGDLKISIASLINGQRQYYIPDSDEDGKWKFFAYKFHADAATVTVYLPSAQVLATKDFRITYNPTNITSYTDSSRLIIKETVLIYPASSGNVYIPISECKFWCDGENVSDLGNVYFEDLLKYKINQKKGIYPGEVYIDNCREGIQYSTNAALIAKHTNPNTNEVTEYDIDDCYLGVCSYTHSGVLTVQTRTDISGYLLVEQTLNESNTVIAQKKYNSYFDVVEENSENITTTYTRNTDLVTAVKVNSPNYSYTRYTTYGTNSAGDPTITEKNEFNNSTIYVLDPIWGVIKSVTLPDGSVVTDTYDDGKRVLTKRTFGSAYGRSNSIAYSNDWVSTMESDTLSYDFGYTNGKISSVNRNDVRMEEHTYSTTQVGSHLHKTDKGYYPSQQTTIYSEECKRNAYGAVTDVTNILENTYDIAPTFNSSTGVMTSNGKNSSALLAKTVDKVCNETARYTYNYEKGRLSQKEVSDSTSYSSKKSKETFTYDQLSRLTKDVCNYNVPDSKRVTSEVEYAKPVNDPFADNRVGKYTYTIRNSISAITQNGYNDLKRVNSKTYTINGKAFKQTFTINKTRVSRIRDIISTTANTDYTYDSCGRIQKVEANGVITTYHYDSYGQLVREDNQALDATFVYVYNSIGGLTGVKEYAYTASGSTPTGTPLTTSYTYSADRLTGIGNTTIAYNTIGCPTTYDGKTVSWSRGKVSGMVDNSLSNRTCTYGYNYNAYGQRISKNFSMTGSRPVASGATTYYNKKYYYDHAGRLISETISKTSQDVGSSTEEIVFLYDEAGVIGMTHTVGGTTKAYYFQRNLLGDVVAIYDTSGAMVAKYLYDAWGNCTISSETTNTVVANANPIRYRGYYYDADTGLYYCNARYYSPKWRRFISPDDTSYLDTETVNGLNLYCYCGNDPVNYVDPSGNSIIAICVFIGLSTIIGAAAGAFTAACTGGNILESTIEGAITGLIAATATVFVPQLVALIAPASISAAALTAASTVATFGVAAAGGFATDYVTQRISHKLSGSEDAFDFDRGRAWKTAFMTGIAGIVPTFVDPTKSVLNAMAGATVGMDASFINSVMDVLFTKLL